MAQQNGNNEGFNPDTAGTRPATPSHINIAPRGKSWVNGLLVDGTAGSPTREGSATAAATVPAYLLNHIGRLNASEHLVSDPGGVGVSTVGVEMLPLGFAPLGEIVRVNVNADHAHPFCLETYAAGFGCSKPLIVGPMEFVTILEHGTKPLEVLPLEPNHAGRLNTLSHHASPEKSDAENVAHPSFTHTPRAPHLFDAYGVQRHYCSSFLATQAGENVELMRLGKKDIASLSIETAGSSDAVNAYASVQLTADQCEALARALIDAAHDLRTHSAGQLMVNNVLAMSEGGAA